METKQNQNKGFTLIEIIISLALIGIVYMSLMSYFSDGLRTNNSAKQLQKASTAAQSVMEEMKSYASIQDISKAYNDPSNIALGWREASYDWADAEYRSYGTEFIEQSSYYFKKPVTIDGTKFMVLASIDPSTYSTAKNYHGVSPDSSVAYNSLEIPVFDSYAETQGGFLVKAQDKTEEVINEFLSHYPSGVTRYQIRNNLKRKLIIKIQPEPVDRVRVRASYQYKFHKSGFTDSFRQDIIYEAIYDSQQLHNLFIFFYKYRNQNDIKIVDTTSDAILGHFNMYVVCQDSTASRINTSVNIDGDLSRLGKIHSNIKILRDSIEKTEEETSLFTTHKKQRYADIHIQVYKEGDTFTSDNRITEMTSLRGE